MEVSLKVTPVIKQEKKVSEKKPINSLSVFNPTDAALSANMSSRIVWAQC